MSSGKYTFRLDSTRTRLGTHGMVWIPSTWSWTQKTGWDPLNFWVQLSPGYNWDPLIWFCSKISGFFRDLYVFFPWIITNLPWKKKRCYLYSIVCPYWKCFLCKNQKKSTAKINPESSECVFFRHADSALPGSSISGWKTSHWSHRETLDWPEFSTGDLHFQNHWRCEEENPAIRRFGSWRTTVDLWWSSVKRRSKSEWIQNWSWKHNSFGDANSCCINIFYIFPWYNWYMWKSWCLWTF